MKFSYTAITKDNKTIKGTMEATNRETVVAALNRQGARPVLVKLEGAKSGTHKWGKSVKLKDLVVFTRQLSTMVSAGVPLTRSLATLQGQTENKYFKEVISGIMKDVEGGIALADAFAKYPNVFSEVYINMVR
ncbi:MAG: Type secretion system protein, partial [Candidatus Saccharibacteria bacterium]|nr:Type secretion system protein [Candidatus Saccharibacteria bacterium]